MLSVENPPDPSCSCKISGLKGDGKASEEFALQDAADLVRPAGLDVNQLPHFSIRDYVFTARSKNISANWPFPQHFLQLCLKHGVKDLLPPFEPPDLVRGRCRIKGGIRSEHLTACVDSEKALAETDPLGKEDAFLLDLQDNHITDKPCQPLDRSVLEFLDRGYEKSCTLSKSLGLNGACGQGDIASTPTSHVEINHNSVPADRLTCSLHETNGLLEASIELEALEPPHPSNKKCQLIVKLGGVSESSPTEEIVSNSCALSEPMASKVCPVCKTFASTSNTTLNAHIDQCLAVESTCKQALADMTKYRVKPMKKRLMVDIYATASCCTLEDLDRRNGTNWAIDSNSSMPNGEIRVERKRQQMGQVDVGDDGDDERAVYVDSNGTKLRILSKLNDAMASTVGDDFTLRNHSKDTKEGKICLMGKKKYLAPKCSKRVKVKSQSKKLLSLRLCKGEIPEAPDEEYNMKKYEEKEKSLSQLLKAQGPIKQTSGSGTLGQWVCSKRSGLSKKFSDRDSRGCAGDQSLIESNMSALGNFTSERNHIFKFSRLSENPSTSIRSKRVETPLNNTDNDERRSPRPAENNLYSSMKGTSVADGRMLKFSSSGSYVSSRRSKKVEINTGTVQTSRKMPESHPFSPKEKKSSALRKDLLLGKPSLPLKPHKRSENRKNSTFKKSQKDMYIAEMSEQVEILPSDVDEDYNRKSDSAENLGPSFVHMNSVRTTDKLNHLQNITGSEIEAKTYEQSLRRNRLLESEEESEDDVSTSEREETVISEGLHSADEYCSPDMASVYSEDCGGFHQYYISVDQESAAEEVSEKAVGDTIMRPGETRPYDGNAPTTYADARSPCLDEDHVGPVCRVKSWAEPITPRSYDDQVMNCVDEAGDKTKVVKELEVGSLTETDATLIQRLGAGFLSPGDAGCDVQENSSLTSSEPHFSQDQHQQVDRDQSGSPISANSAISPPPLTITNFKYSGQEAALLVGPAFLDKVSVCFTDSTAEATLQDSADLGPGCALPSTPSAEGVEQAKLDKESLKAANLPAKEPVKFLDDQPCCCSRKENISWGSALSYQESQFPRQKGMVATLIMPPKGRQVTTSNLNIKPESWTSFSTCSGSRIDKLFIPPLDSPTGSISMTASSNSALKPQTGSDFSLGSPSSQSLPPPSSTCSPVLRLMGKDLMVMSNDENESARLQSFNFAATNDHQNAKYPNLVGFSTGNISNQDSFSFHHQSPNDCFIVGSDPPYPPKNFDAGFSSGLRNHSNYKVVPQTPLQRPVNHRDMQTAGFVGSAMQQGSKGRADGPSQQKTRNKKPNSPFLYNVERSSPHHQQLKPVSASQVVNSMEVIFIDDPPELGPNSSSIGPKYTMGMRGNQPSLVGNSPPPISNSNSRPMKPLSCFPLPNPFSRELLDGRKPTFLMSCPVANASSSKRGGDASEASGVLSPSPSILPSPSTGYLNPTLYYSPSLR